MIVFSQRVVYEKLDIKYLKAFLGVRYWEDATIDGVEDSDGSIPCREGDTWAITIDVDEGRILDWDNPNQDTIASVHYKVCDDGKYELYTEKGNLIRSVSGVYVPSFMCPKGNGDGDYVIMNIDGAGFIENFKFEFDEDFWEQ